MPEDYDDLDDDREPDSGCDDDYDDSGCPDASEIYAQHDPESDSFLIDGVGFADPGGASALRAATRSNPRVHPCPTCKRPNMLTRLDVNAHYQCDRCAERDEGGGSYGGWEY